MLLKFPGRLQQIFGVGENDAGPGDRQRLPVELGQLLGL